jgi:hypothetical protein
MKDEQDIIQEFLAGDLDYEEAVEELCKTGLIRPEAERIMDEYIDY